MPLLARQNVNLCFHSLRRPLPLIVLKADGLVVMIALTKRLNVANLSDLIDAILKGCA